LVTAVIGSIQIDDSSKAAAMHTASCLLDFLFILPPSSGSFFWCNRLQFIVVYKII
jgi:hypothetical protein